MNKLEQLHFDNHDYRDAAEITEQVAIEFAVWLNKTDEIADKTKHIDFTKSDSEVAKDLFEEFLKTKQ